MNLSKKQEKELLEVYKTWWNSYLNGDINTYNHYLDDDFRFVGSTAGEEFLNRTDTTAFFEATADQLAGKAKLENVIRSIETLDGMVLITDLADAYILDKTKWDYYARFRFTSLLRLTKNGWRFVYQHFSTPDLKAQEGETLGLEKVTAENLELRTAIKRRTVELELKNRELEIEASLERVRATAMAMQKSDELSDLVNTVFVELTKLDFALSWCIINIIDEPSLSNMVWGANPEIGKPPESYYMKFEDHRFHHEMMAAYQARLSKWVFELKGKEKKDYDDYLFSQTEFKRVPKSVQDQMRSTKKYVASFTFSNFGGIQTIGEVPLSDANLDILARFGQVFDLTYTRFNDLQKAEAQAREAQIEAALERVRTQSMGMQTSEDLSKVTTEMFKQLRQFGGELFATGIVFCDKHKGHVEQWHSIPKAGMMSPFIIPVDLDYIHQYRYDQWKKGAELFSIEIPSDFIEQHFDDIFKLPSAQVVLKEFEANKTPMPSAPDWEIDYGASFKHGYLLVSSLQPFQEAEILPRFAKVFEQTYTRFLDLQKAEAQLRESKIEAGLERLRSRSMAMHKSDELIETAIVLYKELTKLGISPFSTGFVLVDEENSKQELWFSAQGGEGYMTRFNLPLTGDPVLNKRYRSWKNKETIFHEKVSGKRLLKHLEFVAPYFGTLEAEEEAQKFPDSVVFYCSYFPLGYLHVLSETILDSDQESIMKRFTKVFAMTYTRFLDLQKAEAQAREAQIEAALERVRARTMAMQHSNELLEVASVMFKQVNALGVSQWNCGFNIWEDGDQEFTYYPGSPDGKIIPFASKIPLNEHPVFKRFEESKKRGEELLIYEKKGKEQKDHYDYMLSLPGVGDFLRSMMDADFELPTFQIDHIANFAYGNLIFITYEPFPEMHDVFIRFAKVFEQTYTRFLDLQKAEAQAREAQIEAALERVRARSMAMHQSDELKDVIKEIFDQMAQLDINAEHAGIVVDYEPKKDWHFWVAETQDIPAKITVPYLNLVWDGQFTEAKRKGESFFTTQLDFEEKNSFYKELLPHIEGLTKKAQDFYFSCPGLAASTVIQKDIGLYIENFSGIPYTDEENSILMRIGKVFQQTYTRFLDLQKAEAQAREAQIEAALERVRARSMAMHESSEMLEVANVLFQQLRSLGGNLWGCGVVICQKDVDDDEVWFANENGVLPPVIMPHTEDITHHNIYKGWVNKLELYSEFKEGKELKAHYDYMLSVPNVKPLFENILTSGLSFPTWQKWHAAYFKFGYLLIITLEHYKDEKIFTRFAKVFDQAYTRFLDLQKAEAQAREAQIEAALEKVRSRSLAMHKPEELQEVVAVVAEKLKELGVIFDAGGVILCTYFPDNKDVMHWIAVPDFSSSGSYLVPYFDNPIFNDSWESKNKGDTYFSKEFPVEAKNDFFNHAFENSDYKHFPDDYKQHVLQAEKHTLTAAWSKNSAIIIPSLTGVVPSESDAEIMKRFAKVFEQAYIRFMDLQKAEAQAREAQIEAALEKVRSRTMAMQKGEELKDVVVLLYKELIALGVTNFATCGYVEINEKTNRQETWVTSPGGDSLGLFYLPLTGDVHFDERYEAWKKQQTVFHQTVAGKERRKHLEYAITTFNSKEAEEMVLNQFPDPTVFYCFNFSHGYLHLVSGSYLNKEEESLLARFTRVFEQTYARFLDLEKAAAQAREAQIETALERVRSRTTGMQKSEELREVIQVIHDQLIHLNFEINAAGFTLDYHQNNDWNTWIANKSGSLPSLLYIPYIDHPQFNFYKSAKEKGLDFLANTLSFEEKNSIFNYMFGFMGDYPQAEKNELLSKPGLAISQAFLKNISLWIYNLDAIPYSDEDNNTLMRFAKVFEQTYTRFLDLQKAEAQAREAQIEAALERTRNQSMQMQHSDEINDLSKIFHEQLHVLNIPSEFSYVWLPDEDKEEHMFWATWSEKTKASISTRSKSVVYPLDKTEPYTAACYKAWASEEPVHITKILPEETADFFAEWKELLKGAKKLKPSYFPEGIYYAEAYMKFGCFGINIRRSLENDEADILHRFAIEFERAYTRFLDLQKSEAQAREAQIEVALERVRSQTMAMHNSQDVGKTVLTFFDEVMKLGLNKGIRCGIGILEDREKMETWSATSYPNGDVDLQVGLLDMERHPLIKGLKAAWKNMEDGYIGKLIGEDVVRYYEQLIEEPDYPFHVDLENLSDIEYHRSFFFSSGIIFTFTKTPISEEAALVLNRFASVFGQTYRRFLDLQKAEAQAREARIEASLEKVRARTMAMQSSSELVEAANLLFKQVRDLGINAWSAGYNVLSDDKTQSKCWMSSEDQLQDPFTLYYTEEASFIEMGNFLKGEEDFFVQELGGEDLIQHYDYMKSVPELMETFKGLEKAGLTLPTHQINHLCKFSKGYLLFITYESVPEAHEIFKRFTKVFEQTYTRFLDLEKAEAQAREAEIELALERVRASTMAMHKSEQLAETAEVLFEQFDLLGVTPDRISIAIFNEKKRIFELWATDQRGSNVNHVHDFSIDEPTCMAKTYKAWEEKKEIFIVDLKGKALKDWVRYVKEEAKMELDESKFKGRRVQNCAFFSQGYLLLSSHLPISEEILQLLLRFAKVFQQTYTRFLDLQKAEAQAREAIKHASVDRVRAEIASMRNTSDLKRITPLIWNELNTLDVPFIRCGVFIMDEEKQEVQTHLSTPDGKAIASFNLPFENTEPLTELLPNWRKKEMYKDYWDASAFIESMNVLMDRGAISSSESYMTDHQPDNLHLHFLPFLQGMLYVGSEVPLTEDELYLVQNLAEAFSTAYSRYDDFNKLELANKKIEKTLVDLKQTQTQLIQSEKMASLGELTAGIAHEIQNPLNFVNNFSEVSQELMQEMHEELDKGDLAEALEIGNDIEQNLEKIKHHGQRASEIVKGMLQHSRSSSGVKELTDVNALTDEYLRLAYHGLRAKDKSFNAKLETEFDEHLEKINVIPQDIGRVILNLITNAFYAVNEKKNEQGQGYEPVVNVGTKKIKEGIEIRVKDNGKGIPQKVLDKIFQPFFTTKPTGQGTGLGLSLSYDIIKAHGGELKVETKENEGTEFKIILPI